jgi:tight adherence protein B
MATLRRVEKQGKLPTLDKLLWQWFPNAGKIRHKLQTSGMNLTLGDFAFASIALAVAVAFVLSLLLDLPPGMVLVGSLLIGVGIPNLVVGFKAKRRGRQFNLLFPEAIDLIVRALRAGLPVQEAIGNVARDIKDPVGGVFMRAQNEMQLGVPIEQAMWRVARTVQTDEFNFLIIALSIQRDTGGNLAETLANLSALLRARQQLRLKIRAFTSEARATMLIMAGLPFLVGGALFLISPKYIGPLFTTPTGQMVAAAAACSMGLGIFIMNKIATIKV